MNFKQYRKKFGTQTALANILKIDVSTVNKWEKGKSKPTVDKVIKLAQVLNVTEQEIFNCFKKEE